MKYTQEEIDRIFNERVRILYYEPQLKKGMIAEWTFTYPTGERTADVECAFPMYEEEHDPAIASQLIISRLYEIRSKVRRKSRSESNPVFPGVKSFCRKTVGKCK